MTAAEGGRREEVERDGSTLAKLGGAMMDTALAMANQVASRSTLATSLLKRAMTTGLSSQLAGALHFFLSPKSAYVSGQVVRVGEAGFTGQGSGLSVAR